MAGTFSSLTTACNSNATCLSCQLGSDVWILDSGENDYMSYDAKFLHDLRLLNTPITVSLPNGQRVQVTHCGTLRLNSWIELQHVLLVPHFKYNLLSVKQLVRELDCDVIFSKELCSLQGSSLKRPVVVGKETFGLYLLEKNLVKEVQYLSAHTFPFALGNNLPTLSEPFNATCNQSSKNIGFDTWHRRIGHMPAQRMKLLPIDVNVPKNNEHTPL